jgi:hypothetical protein
MAHMLNQLAATAGRLLFPAALVPLAAALILACGDDRAAKPISVTRIDAGAQVTVVAQFDQQEKAAQKASDLAGFAVLPVKNLPGRFHVTGFSVHTASATPRSVEVFVGSDGAGGLDIVQSVGPDTPQSGGSATVTPIQSAAKGRFWKWQDTSIIRYYLVTDEFTFTLTPGPGTQLSEDEAVTVLAGFAG